MNPRTTPFWETKTLRQMTPREWEALCDGCGACCLEKRVNMVTGVVTVFSVCCEYLDVESCRCAIYKERAVKNPECITITPGNVGRMGWLPQTCAYRLLSEGKDLEWWHPLLSRSPDTVHQAGISIRNRAVSGKFVHPEDLK